MQPRPLRTPTHISHSARETLNRCAKSYFLKYIAGAPQRPALWLAGGSAVHEVTEAWDKAKHETGLSGRSFGWDIRDVLDRWEQHFNAQLEECFAKEPNQWNWKRSNSEPIEVWNTIGPQFVQSYIDWRQRSPYEIWTTPDGVPAIELDVSGYLPGCPVEIKAYLDRVFVDPVFKKLIVLDLKSGKRPPTSGDQFGTYGALLKVKYGVTADLGLPFMNRKATVGKPFELAEYTPEFVGEIFGEAWARIQAGEFEADTSDCYICDVSSSCYAKGGPLSATYDPSNPLNDRPPF